MRRIFYYFISLILLALACSAVEDPDIVSPGEVEATDLSGKRFFFSYLCDLDLSNKNLQGANFHLSILQEVNLRNSDLHNADFMGADLRGADLRNSNLTGATLDYALLRWAKFDGATLDEKWSRIIDILITGNGDSVNLDEADLRGVNFSGRPGGPITADNFRCSGRMDRKIEAGLWFSLKNGHRHELCA